MHGNGKAGSRSAQHDLGEVRQDPRIREAYLGGNIKETIDQ